VEEVYKTQSFPGLEADDVMGILATRPGVNCVIVSQDKDMKTIPGSVWNGEELTTYSEDEADYHHMLQTLTGDTADGYKGCPGVGKVKAEKILAACTVWEDGGKTANVYPMWPAVGTAYEKAGLTEADALQQARLARILRWSDWDRVNKQPILWSPN
jgi:DNA polymerase-1